MSSTALRRVKASSSKSVFHPIPGSKIKKGNDKGGAKQKMDIKSMLVENPKEKMSRQEYMRFTKQGHFLIIES